jgi:molecular chaperone DnaK
MHIVTPEMIAADEANAEADKKERERIDKMNQADSMIFQTENQLKELGDKLSADGKSSIEAALKKLKDAHAAGDLAGIDVATAELNNAWQTASQNMYQGAQGQPGAGAGFQGGAQNNSQQGTNNGTDDVQDADFEEVK